MKDHYNQKWVKWLFWKSEWAITLFGHTFYTVTEDKVSHRWRTHEDCHKRQQRIEGWYFYPKYLMWLITKGYYANPYEVEARLEALRCPTN